jgi:hypothetical protein
MDYRLDIYVSTVQAFVYMYANFKNKHKINVLTYGHKYMQYKRASTEVFTNYIRTAKTHSEDSKQIFPGKELRGCSPNSYIHVSVSDLYIPLNICGNICIDRPQAHECGNWD